MCGRYSLTKLQGLRRFGLDQLSIDFKPRYNVAPSQTVPVVLSNNGFSLEMFKWGLVPHWAKDAKIGYKMINARAETVETKPSFRTLVKTHRCLILADGFYEWKQGTAGKRPYRITLKDDEVFGFAGLWDTWMNPAGEAVNSCTIVTTTPNDLMAEIHDRMPVILPRDAEQIWLDHNITDSLLLKDLLKPYDSGLMSAYEVSTLVNSPKNDAPECILPIVY